MVFTFLVEEMTTMKHIKGTFDFRKGILYWTFVGNLFAGGSSGKIIRDLL
jgi:hypothetical protein